MLTGHPNQVVPSLCRSIERYTRKYSRFYVGRTQDPWSRMAAHNQKWAQSNHTLEHMIMIYKSGSFASMVKVEAGIIEHIKSTIQSKRNTKELLNKRHGDWQESFVFYLYMLVDDGSRKESLSKDVDWDQMHHRGLASESMGQIRKLIRDNAEDQEYIYVGFTDDPDRRFYQHQRIYEKSASWSKMVVLFEGSNLHDTYVAENLIINYALGKFGSDMCLNASQKYEPDARQPYLVYVLAGD